MLGLLSVTVIGALAFNFYWRNLRGSGPAFQPPADDIVELINNSQKNTNNSSEPGKNQTDFPLNVPDNITVAIFASGLVNPRVIVFDPNGVMLVSVPSQGTVLALPDDDDNGVADQVITLISGLNRPHGLAFDCDTNCTLYVAETDGVAMYDYDQAKRQVSNARDIIELPGGSQHFSRTLLISNNQLLIAVGSSCNVCRETDWRRAKILAANLDGSNLREYAVGLRNAVFMTSNPSTGEVWATEMGRDLLGDDLPPDEINIIKDGSNYGWPICYGQRIHDSNFDKNVYIRDPCADTQPAQIDLQAHSAPLGLAFFPKTGWPEEYRGDLLVAYHGSWNRSVPTGYKVVRFKLSATGQSQGMEDFISGWLTQDRRALGRPVDIAIQPNGVLYISDDKAGVIYRVTYAGQ